MCTSLLGLAGERIAAITKPWWGSFNDGGGNRGKPCRNCAACFFVSMTWQHMSNVVDCVWAVKASGSLQDYTTAGTLALLPRNSSKLGSTYATKQPPLKTRGFIHKPALANLTLWDRYLWDEPSCRHTYTHTSDQVQYSHIKRVFCVIHGQSRFPPHSNFHSAFQAPSVACTCNTKVPRVTNSMLLPTWHAFFRGLVPWAIAQPSHCFSNCTSAVSMLKLDTVLEGFWNGSGVQPLSSGVLGAQTHP